MTALREIAQFGRLLSRLESRVRTLEQTRAVNRSTVAAVMLVPSRPTGEGEQVVSRGVVMPEQGYFRLLMMDVPVGGEIAVRVGDVLTRCSVEQSRAEGGGYLRVSDPIRGVLGTGTIGGGPVPIEVLATAGTMVLGAISCPDPGTV